MSVNEMSATESSNLNWLQTFKLAFYIESKMCLTLTELCSENLGHQLETVLQVHSQSSHRERLWQGIENFETKWMVKTWRPWTLVVQESVSNQMITSEGIRKKYAHCHP